MNPMTDPSPDRPAPALGGSQVGADPGKHDPVAAVALPTRLLTRLLTGAGRLTAACWRRLDSADRTALGVWAAAHLALLVLAWAAAWVYRSDASHAPLTGAFQHWDANLLQNIAQHGYFSADSAPNSTAFFPGFPLALAAAHPMLLNWTLSELMVSGIAGCFAVVSLSRLAGSRRAVLYLLAMPAAVFLMVGYAECLFLALAIPAWHAAVKGRWWRAVVLAGLSGLVREDAVWLILALVVMALTGPRAQVRPTADLREHDQQDPVWEHPAWQRLGNAVTCCLAFAGPGAYLIYLRVCTGAWNAWAAAEQAGWAQHLVPPLQALKTTYGMAFQHTEVGSYAFEAQLEIVTEAVMILATLGFLCWRRWPEAVYCGLPAIGLGTQTFYHAAPRTLLLLFPVCSALARLDARRPWIRYLYFGLSTPLAAVLGLLFLAGQWSG
jgi:hypothetical protein